MVSFMARIEPVNERVSGNPWFASMGEPDLSTIIKEGLYRLFKPATFRPPKPLLPPFSFSSFSPSRSPSSAAFNSLGQATGKKTAFLRRIDNDLPRDRLIKPANSNQFTRCSPASKHEPISHGRRTTKEATFPPQRREKKQGEEARLSLSLSVSVAALLCSALLFCYFICVRHRKSKERRLSLCIANTAPL